MFPIRLPRKNSGRTGLPATNAFPPNVARLSSCVTAAALTSDASSRLVSPGTAFCSINNVGILRSAASADWARAVSTDADHDRRTASRQHAPGVESAGRQQPSPRASDGSDLPGPALRITSSVKPSRGTTRLDAGGRADKRHLCVRHARRSALATAMPGYRCPPVPPPAINTDSATHSSCCEMLSSTPMPNRLIKSDDPPELTKGRGMPWWVTAQAQR